MFGKKRIQRLERKIEILEYTVRAIRKENHIPVYEKLEDNNRVYCSGVYYRNENLLAKDVIFLILEKLGLELVYKASEVKTTRMNSVLEEVVKEK